MAFSSLGDNVPRSLCSNDRGGWKYLKAAWEFWSRDWSKYSFIRPIWGIHSLSYSYPLLIAYCIQITELRILCFSRFFYSAFTWSEWWHFWVLLKRLSISIACYIYAISDLAECNFRGNKYRHGQTWKPFIPLLPSRCITCTCEVSDSFTTP